ncbi:hypothetical protein [Olsenella profusa]|uniref:Flp pilus-assembly TadG-like N-terminal domain-containing protein n=1 Tax=Olsenella profusa TaxID=138595 RepID=A0ABS2F0C2_9ACTN|nr:hypothetical protein [Olsenella profusa]
MRRRGGAACGLSAFRDDEGGFTTVAVAISLLLSLTLVFSAASAGWVAARSSEVQRVADATALAGQNVVASFSTIVQVLDACLLSMGLTGIVTYGAGLVVSCVPGLGATGAELCATGGRVLEARRSFARSAATGVQRLEATLPLIMVANSASCVAANSSEGTPYTGCALPFPATSASDFSALTSEVDDGALSEVSGELREASEEARQARERADEALERGWEADCGARPYCLRERAASLAGLSESQNPDYPAPDGWTFGAPLSRARAYYAARLAAERPQGEGAEALTDSACRRAFYDYALSEVRSGSYRELPDGAVSIDLPRLPRNADETRATRLYTTSDWPCTIEGGGRTLHCSLECPGALGAVSGMASLAEVESGGVLECPVCQMSVTELGRVASASTSISNGFEHHWRDVVDAAEDYEVARSELAVAEARTRELAEQGADSFAEALDQLSLTRPTLCPPGAWGCVAVVARAEGESVPTELTGSFLSSAELPAGAAASAAVLAPDESTEENNVLSSFFDALGTGDSVLGGMADGVLELWGDLLMGYGSAYGDVSDVAGRFLDGLDGVLGGSVGSWLRGRLKAIMEDAGLAPVDLRLRKPVLTNTQDVLDRGGFEQASVVRELVALLPDSPSAHDFATAAGLRLVDEVGDARFTVAELPLPGTGVSIPLTVDLARLGEAA